MCPMPGGHGAQACWPWHVGGLPGAQPLLARSAAAFGCVEGLPVRCCYFGPHPPLALYPKSCARSSTQHPKGRLEMFFPQPENSVLGSARSLRSRSLVRGLCCGL